MTDDNPQPKDPAAPAWTVDEYEQLKRMLKVDRKRPPLPLDDECPEKAAFEPGPE